LRHNIKYFAISFTSFCSSRKKEKIYPQIRLPPHLFDTIGEIADIFETERNGKRAFLLVTEQPVLDDDMVLQPNEKVVKPCVDVAQTSIEAFANVYRISRNNQTQRAA
jgi:hypothetical protein